MASTASLSVSPVEERRPARGGGTRTLGGVSAGALVGILILACPGAGSADHGPGIQIREWLVRYDYEPQPPFVGP